jgi:hypothetical protein
MVIFFLPRRQRCGLSYRQRNVSAGGARVAIALFYAIGTGIGGVAGLRCSARWSIPIAQKVRRLPVRSGIDDRGRHRGLKYAIAAERKSLDLSRPLALWRDEMNEDLLEMPLEEDSFAKMTPRRFRSVPRRWCRIGETAILLDIDGTLSI